MNFQTKIQEIFQVVDQSRVSGTELKKQGLQLNQTSTFQNIRPTTYYL